MNISIWSARWSTGDVLVADHKIEKDNTVTIQTGDGEGSYYLSGRFARTFPVEDMNTKAGGTVRVRVIPLEQLKKEVIE